MALLDAATLSSEIKNMLDAAFGDGTVEISTARTSFCNAVATPTVGQLYAGFRVTSIWSALRSALPISTTFTSNGGTLVVFVTGSMFVGTAGTIAAMNVLVDGTTCGTLSCYCNEASSHKTLVPAVYVVTGRPAGTRTLQFTVSTGNSDSNDFYSAAVLELPV